MTMKQNMSSVYQPGKCEDSLKSLRILIYVISGLTIIMYFYYMLPTAIFPHRVMQTTQVNEERYGDGLEPMPYTMRGIIPHHICLAFCIPHHLHTYYFSVVAILQYLMATMGLLSSFYLGHGVYFVSIYIRGFDAMQWLANASI